jgi:hypothetical protein
VAAHLNQKFAIAIEQAFNFIPEQAGVNSVSVQK